MEVKAILSTTLLLERGNYDFEPLPSQPDVKGVPHYVGHPATRGILDAAGAVYTPGKFSGIAPGEGFFVAQLKDSRRGAFTVDQPNVAPDDIQWGLVRRNS